MAAERAPLASVKLGPGRVVLVVGPSGSGKDTLLRFAAEALGGRDDILFVRRLVTRPRDASREDHDSLSREEFERMRQGGDYALCWEAHGHGYMVPRSVCDAVAAGRTAVFNASRSAIADAIEAFETVLVVVVEAPAEVLATRLAARGGESRTGIEERLKRAAYSVPEVARVTRIVNDDTVEKAGQALIEAIAGD